MVCANLKYLVDAENNRHVAVPAVCAGTLCQMACLVKIRVPTHVMQGFLVVVVVVDQRCDFEAIFAHECGQIWD